MGFGCLGSAEIVDEDRVVPFVEERRRGVSGANGGGCASSGGCGCDVGGGMTKQEREEIIEGVARYGKAFLAKYPKYLVLDENGQLKLRVLAHMASVYNIDTVGQSFQCKLIVQLRWYVRICEGEPTENEREIVGLNIDYGRLGLWIPKLEFVNNLGKIKIDDMRVRGLPKMGDEVEMVCSFTVQGQFFEKFEVNYFPFDTQQLQIYAVFVNCPHSVVVTEAEQFKGNRESAGGIIRNSAAGDARGNVFINTGRMLMGLVDLVGIGFDGDSGGGATSSSGGSGDSTGVVMTEIKMPVSVNICKDSLDVYEENFVQSDSWRLGAMELRQGRTLYDRDEDGVAYSTIRLIVNIERRYWFFFWNIVFPVFILVNLSFSSFLLGESALIDRLTVTLTLILTMFALKFAVSQYLPPTNYLTYLDRYVVISYVMLSIVAAQNVACSVLERVGDDGGVSNDQIFNIVTGGFLFVCWWIFNIGILLILLRKKLRKRIVGRLGVANGFDEVVVV